MQNVNSFPWIKEDEQMQQKPFEYKANVGIFRAANDNAMPRKDLIKKLLKISLWIAPLSAWLLLWAN
jgi:hypothetical protein